MLRRDRIVDPVRRHGDTGYDVLRRGFNLAIEHHPEVIVEALSPTDVVAAVRLAARNGLAVAVMNTGHGPSVAADGAVLIRIGSMNRVSIDPVRRTARIEGGAKWANVISAAALYGLAPLNGSSPDVGAVGYTLGGGVGLLARRFGFAADHVRWCDVVTADGQLHHVTPDSDVDLFWALRGAGTNFGVVTAMEIDLFPVATLLGGELAFGPEQFEEALSTYVTWTSNVPETMASSILLMEYPEDAAEPENLRGRYITHVRLAYSGDDEAEGFALLRPLRRSGRIDIDTIRRMPYAHVGTIHHDATDAPVAAFDRNTLLGHLDEDAVRMLSRHLRPAQRSPLVVELRAWGGALSRPPLVANAISFRDAAFSLLAISDAKPGNRRRRDELLAAMRPWSTGMAYPNFNGVDDASTDAVRRTYGPDVYARLRQLKTRYDPDNMFRVNFNITPHWPVLRPT